MIHNPRPLILSPVLPEPHAYGTPAWEDPDHTSKRGGHTPFCGLNDVHDVATHTGLCRATSYLEHLSDPRGEMHEVVVERVAQYAHGVYDAAEYRIRNDYRTFIRIGIDLDQDPTKDQYQGLVLTSGDARQLAAVLIAEADRADRILPNT